ncbi:hypothetical protein HGA11_07440 [Mycolicibacterium septicum DSM 44393]|uniref:Transposase n=1 Tax=Mycolicibacterium septicum DSM 44393 TaxID=1341646 RepID=A0A7X6RUX5_9MYCO|nr:hypothetical protein [Mycolicibacterium septicum DSM 44393]
MLATVIAERLRWPFTMNPLRVRLREIRPEYLGIDSVDRVHYQPGEVTQCDLWFPAMPISSGGSRTNTPVLVMTLGSPGFIAATMLPSRQGGDLLREMWELISQMGKVTKTLVWEPVSTDRLNNRPPTSERHVRWITPETSKHDHNKTMAGAGCSSTISRW